MGFEEPGEGAVGFWGGPSTERFCIFGRQIGLDSKGEKGALWADVLEDLSIDLEAIEDGT